MSDFTVLIADSRYPAHDEERGVLEAIGAEVVLERSDDETKIAAAVRAADGLVVNLAPITAAVVDAMDKCKCVSRYGVGYDNVDTAALKAKGIGSMVMEHDNPNDYKRFAERAMQSFKAQQGS